MSFDKEVRRKREKQKKKITQANYKTAICILVDDSADVFRGIPLFCQARVVKKSLFANANTADPFRYV